jgi:protein-S-isoprenylcysteine O-methyltransferase Ste14
MKYRDDRRTIFGVGPKWMVWSIICSAPILLITAVTHPFFVMVSPKLIALQIIGLMMVGLGLVFWLLSVRTMIRAFAKRQLVTSGVFGLCRNPIYSSFIVFTVPGIALLLRMPILLLIPFIMYLVLKHLIADEEKALLDIFGEEYQNYRANVNAVIPISYFKKTSK